MIPLVLCWGQKGREAIHQGTEQKGHCFTKLDTNYRMY